jgi:stage V sporulation protein B
MKKEQTITENVTMLTASGILNKILAIVYLSVQTTLVGDIGNGIIEQGYTIYIFIFSLSTAGIPVALSKLIAEEDSLGRYKNSKQILKVSTIFIFSISTILAVLMASGSSIIAYFLGEKTRLMIMVLSPALLFTSISSVFRGYFQGKMNMKPTAISQVLEQLINSILTIVFIAIFVKYGLAAAAAGSSLATVLGALCAAVFLVISYIKYNKSNNTDSEQEDSNYSILTFKQIVKKLMKYVIPAILGIVAINLSNFIDLIIVPLLNSIGYDEETANFLFGILKTKYQRILNLLLMFGAAISSAMTPSISSAFVTKNFVKLKHNIIIGLRAIFIIIIPSVIGVSILAKYIIILIFPTKTEGSEILAIGVWVAIPMTLVYIQNSILNGVGKPHISPRNLLLSLSFKVLCILLLIRIEFINIKSSIIGTFIAFFITVILNNFAISKYAKIKINIVKYIYKPIIASVFMGIFLRVILNKLLSVVECLSSNYYISNIVLIVISVLIGIFVYFTVMIIIKGLEKDDILRLPGGKIVLNKFKCFRLFKNKNS